MECTQSFFSHVLRVIVVIAVYFFHAFHDKIFYVWNSTTSSSRGIFNIDKEGVLLCHTFSVQLSNIQPCNEMLSDNRQSTKKHNTYQLLHIYRIPSDDGLQICPEHVEVD